MTTIFPVIFCSARGRPWVPARLYAIHRHVCILAGLRVNRLHDLRHSYALIQLYEYHAPIQYVSEQLGHSSLKITVDTYGHPRQGISIALADQLDSPGAHATICTLRATRAVACHRRSCYISGLRMSI